MDQVQMLLQQLKQNYLAELPERVDKLEYLVLELERHGYSQGLYHELYRQVHSLKGSGGTYGLHAITSICHPLEDFLSTVDEKSVLSQMGFANIALAYLDILRDVLARMASKPDTIFDIEHLLTGLRQRSFEPKYYAMLVENSSTVVKMISRVLHLANFRIAVQDDGYLALGRALAERFDLIISAQEVKQLNGSALIAAVKLSYSGANQTKTILLTANPTLQNQPNQPNQPNQQNQPDYLLSKDDQLSSRLHALLKKIVAEFERNAMLANK